MRKDTLEGVEISSHAKRALEERRKNANEFECLEGEGFSLASTITVVEAKAKKRKRR